MNRDLYVLIITDCYMLLKNFWICFIKLLVLVPDRFWYTFGFGRKTAGLLPEVSGNRKF
jgi:hypothetical protein